MAGLDPSAAAKLVDVLDREIAKRQARKDAEQDAQWERECADDIILLAKRLSRGWDRLQQDPGRPRCPSPMSPEDVECMLEETLDYAKALFSIAEGVELEEQRKEIEPSGAPRRKPVIMGPRVQNIAGLGRDPAAASAKSKKVSRTEIALQKADAELQARHAFVRRSQQQQGHQPVEETIIKIGTVQQYDSRSMSGVVSIGGGPGRLELPFGASEIMRAGITTLSPGQSIECHLTKQSDGSLVIAEIKLSVGERAAAIADLERQAQVAEENYRIELMRRRVH